MANYKVAFSGASGTGKTTLAKWVSETLSIPFISSSMSDLLPHTASIHQQQMNDEPLLAEEVQLRELRHKKYQEFDGFVTDRSYLDSIAYFLYKLSGRGVTDETVQEFIEKCQEYIVNDFTHVIMLSHTYGIARNWKVEDNSKRVKNTYFQWMISSIMSGVLYDSFLVPGYSCEQLGHEELAIVVTNSKGKPLKIMVIEESDIDLRKTEILNFLRYV